MKRHFLIAACGLLVGCLSGCLTSDVKIQQHRRDEEHENWGLQSNSVQPSLALAIAPPPPRQVILPFRFTTNRYHAIQESTNLVDWTTLPGLANCYGPPTAPLDVTNHLAERAHYWRALGHDNYWR